MMAPLTITIETFSDTACPCWCYLRKTSPDRAMETYKAAHETRREGDEEEEEGALLRLLDSGGGARPRLTRRTGMRRRSRGSRPCRAIPSRGGIGSVGSRTRRCP